MSTLIDPQKQSPQAAADFTPAPLLLRHPNTGMIFKLFHRDSIQRCLKEGYTPATEADLREQAVELAELQGRPRPPWATSEEQPAVKVDKVADEKPVTKAAK